MFVEVEVDRLASKDTWSIIDVGLVDKPGRGEGGKGGAEGGRASERDGGEREEGWGAERKRLMAFIPSLATRPAKISTNTTTTMHLFVLSYF